MSNASKYDFWDRNSFSTILTDLLWGSHTTQQRLAEAIGCSRQTVSLYANGNASPDAEKLKLIADFFMCQPIICSAVLMLKRKTQTFAPYVTILDLTKKLLQCFI